MTNPKSLVEELKQLQLATELIEMGARLQILETETDVSRNRLVKLYKEVSGDSPKKGMLPFATNWFLTWQPNIHASLFLNLYVSITECTEMDRMDAFIKAFRIYQEQIKCEGLEEVLDLTRAWTLLRFYDSGMLVLVPCSQCKANFIFDAEDDSPKRHYICGLCKPPSRAGKTGDRKKG